MIERLQAHDHTCIFKHLLSFALYFHFVILNFPHLNKTPSVYLIDLIPSSSFFSVNLNQNWPSFPIFFFPTCNQEQI